MIFADRIQGIVRRGRLVVNNNGFSGSICLAGRRETAGSLGARAESCGKIDHVEGSRSALTRRSPMLRSIPDLSSEVLLRNRSDLQFCCAICGDDRDIARQLLESRRDRIDWLALIEVAKRRRLEMLLYRATDSRFPGFVSSSGLEALRNLYADNLARCRVMTAELLRLLDRLTYEQIPAIPFKGPVLGAQIYGDIALRIYGDLDVLVRECDVDKVTSIMLDQGYQIRMSLNWERSFVRATGESVDVHWAIADEIHQFPLTPEELWARRATITLAGISVPTLCAEDTLLTICFNGLTEDWLRFDRIADVAEFIRGNSAVDWPKFLDTCRQRGCERLVLVGMHLAKELFLVRLPECVEPRLLSHRKAIARAGFAIDDFLTTSAWRREGEDWRLMLRMRERLWERIPYCQSLAYGLFKPKDDDARWQRTSRQVLYQLLRLPLLGVKHGLRVLGHANLNSTNDHP